MTIRKRLLIGLHTRRHKPAENPGSLPSLMSREAWESKTTPSEGHRREYPGGGLHLSSAKKWWMSPFWRKKMH